MASPDSGPIPTAAGSEKSRDTGSAPTTQNQPRNGRGWLKPVGLLTILALVVAAYSTGGLSYIKQQKALHDPLDFAKRADLILETTPLIDGHNDLPYLIRIETKNQIYNEKFTFESGLLSHTDLKKLRKGKVGGQFWSVYTECPEDPKTRIDDPTWSVRDTLEQIDIAKRLVDEYHKDLQYCDTPACARQAFKSGKIGSFLGIEGGHQIGNSLAALRQVYDLGVRYITVTHNCDNAFATAASTVRAGGEDKGLTEFGREFVKEMNRLGMLIDLSHVSHQTMRDVLADTKAPIMFSHSSAYALSKHTRNVPDDVLSLVAKNRGVVMLNFYPVFLAVENPERADIQLVADHVFHIAEVAGWDHVGIGSDFDGVGATPKGLEDVSKYPELIKVLLERGASDDQVRKFVGENILRVWSEVESYSQAMKKVGEKPNEEVWSGRRWTRLDTFLPPMFNESLGNRIPAKSFA